jgi:type II secretory pathway pseudopilin PulG
MKIFNQQKNRNGFTLIELMVATSVFIVIMLASMSALFTLLGSAKNSRALRFAMDNVNFAVDSMTRSIRMGTNYYCVGSGTSMPSDITSTRDCDIGNGGTLIAFVPQDNLTSRIGYMWTEREDGTHTLKRCSSNSSSDCVDIVSADVDIEQLKFFVSGSSDSDDIQPSVYVIMKGTVMVKDVPTSFAIQTMASQRNY